jgi:hypothetical protein
MKFIHLKSPKTLFPIENNLFLIGLDNVNYVPKKINVLFVKMTIFLLSPLLTLITLFVDAQPIDINI